MLSKWELVFLLQGHCPLPDIKLHSNAVVLKVRPLDYSNSTIWEPVGCKFRGPTLTY